MRNAIYQPSARRSSAHDGVRGTTLAAAYRFTFQGQEKDDEIHGAPGTSLNFDARLYDSRVGRWLSVDPLAAATPAISAYTAFSDNPIEQRDHDGRFSISNHYKFTSSALQALGYSEVLRDLISHYASTYADNPGRLIAWQQGQSYRKGIDYSRTSEAQNTASIANSTWHAMKADGENILNIQAMWRGQEFGWSKVIEAGTQAKMVGGVSCLTENSAGIQALGQGIHALQDAIAHRGTDMNHHSIGNDMNPSLQDQLAARTAAYNGVLVAEVVSGDYRHVSDGMTVNLEGATQAQFAEIKQHFDAAIAASDGKVKSVNFTGMRKK